MDRQELHHRTGLIHPLELSRLPAPGNHPLAERLTGTSRALLPLNPPHRNARMVLNLRRELQRQKLLAARLARKLAARLARICGSRKTTTDQTPRLRRLIISILVRFIASLIIGHGKLLPRKRLRLPRSTHPKPTSGTASLKTRPLGRNSVTPKDKKHWT